MKPTLNTVGDVFEKQGFPLFDYRSKPIHPIGVVGSVELVSSGKHPFTGIFTGANHGLIRMAAAWEPTKNHERTLAPGIGLKFLRSGQDSANLVAVRTKTFRVEDKDWTKNPNWDWFSDPLENFIEPV